MASNYPIICGIYKITNPIGQAYVGKSKNIYSRWAGYRSLCFKTQVRLHESFLEYGVKNHTFEILEECDNEVSVEREKYYIFLFKTFTEAGLNKNKGGGGCVSHTEETRRLIGSHSKGNKHRLGKKLSEEQVEKMRQYKMSQETRDKIYPKLRGQKRTDEQRRRMSESKKGVVHSQEHRDKISKTLTGTKHSHETILKRVLANSGEKACMYGKFGKDHPAFGTKRTEDQSRRQSDGLKKAWEKKRAEGTDTIPEERKEKIRLYYANMSGEDKEIMYMGRRNVWLERKENGDSKIFLNINTGIFYYTIQEAADSFNISSTTFRRKVGSNSVPFILT